MDTLSDDAALAGARDFMERIAALWWSAFAGRLIGIYGIGSLAHGGFSRRYSDIDVAVIAEEPLATADLDRMRAVAAEASGELAAKLSIFWADRSFRTGRFPLLDRADYLDHGFAIIERERIRPERPSLIEVRHYLRSGPLERWAKQIHYCRELSMLGPNDHKPYLRSLL